MSRRCVRSGFGCSSFLTARSGRRRTALFAGRYLRKRHIAGCRGAEASAVRRRGVAVLQGKSVVLTDLSFFSPRSAEDASDAAGGTMQPSAWGGCGYCSSGFGRRANLLKLYFNEFRPAGMHCEKSGKSDDTCASVRSDRAKSAVFRDRSASAGGVTRCFSQCLIFWCFWIKPKAPKERI